MLLYFILLFMLFIMYIWLQKINYWRKKGIRGPLPIPFVGNFGKVFLSKQSIDTLTRNIYDNYNEEKYVGIYAGNKVGLLIRDPAVIKQILITDFRFFQDRGVKVSESAVSTNLFAAEGKTWKVLRPKLTTIFTIKKLKEIFPAMQTCVDNLVRHIDYLINQNDDQDIKHLMSKYTASVIGSCVFNVDFNVYSKQMKLLTEITNTIISPSMYFRLSYILDYIFPGISKHLPEADSNKKMIYFFNKLANNVICDRNGNISQKKGFIDVLLQLKKDGKASKADKDGLAEIEINDGVIAAQIFVFFIAGFETSSSTMTFLLYELAVNEQIQHRAYEEINNVAKKYNDQITFESLEDMTYLKMIFDETLRKYPIVGTITRKSTSEYNLPRSNIKIKKGTIILIPLWALHRDSKYFSDPDKFDPERFSNHCEMKKVTENTYMPFGAGPRQCLGLRFGKLQSLLAIATLLKEFKIETSSKTVRHFIDDPKTVTLSQLGGTWLKIVKRR